MSKSDIENERYVCRKCIQDKELQKVVDKHEEKHKCSYCGARKSALLVFVIDRIRLAIGTTYGAAEDNVDSDGNPPEQHGIEEVFHEFGFHVEGSALMADIISVFSDEYYAIDNENAYLFRNPHQAWLDFKKLVKHGRRYTFASVGMSLGAELDSLMWSQGNVLPNIARVIGELTLVIHARVGTPFWRARIHAATKVMEIPKDLTSPPVECAKYSNRMSPAGISMFYGTDDFDTALLEIIDDESIVSGKVATGIQFVSKRDLMLLDLTSLPGSESVFSDWKLEKRIAVGFLSAFADDVSKPIKKDGLEHIEYVPTQVFTEYIRHEAEILGGVPIDGIKYRSSRNGRPCYVLFFEQGECLPTASSGDKEQALEAVPSSVKNAVCKWCPT